MDSRSRDRLILFLSGRHVREAFQLLVSGVETSRSRWVKLSSRGCSEVPDRSTVEVLEKSKGTTLNSAVVRTWTPPQSFMLLARPGLRREDEEELTVR